MWEPKDRGKLSLTEKVMLTHARQSKDFGMAVARTMGKVGVEWRSKESTEKDGSRPAELQSSESWHGRGGRNDGCVRAHGNPGSGFPPASVCAEYQPMYQHSYEETRMRLAVGRKTKNDLSRR